MAKVYSMKLKQKHEELKTIVCDYIQDDNDQKFYLIQVKCLDTHQSSSLLY